MSGNNTDYYYYDFNGLLDQMKLVDTDINDGNTKILDALTKLDTDIVAALNQTDTDIVQALISQTNIDLKTGNSQIIQTLTKLNTDLTKLLTQLDTDLNTDVTKLNTDLTKVVTTLNTDLTKLLTKLNTDLTTSLTQIDTDLVKLDTDVTASLTKLDTDVITINSTLSATLTHVAVIRKILEKQAANTPQTPLAAKYALEFQVTKDQDGDGQMFGIDFIFDAPQDKYPRIMRGVYSTLVAEQTAKGTPLPPALTVAKYLSARIIATAKSEGYVVKDPVQVVVSTQVVIKTPGDTFDGVTLNAGDTLLLSGQTTPVPIKTTDPDGKPMIVQVVGGDNGIYTFNGTTEPLTRAPTANTPAGLLNTFIPILQGSQKDAFYVLTTTDTIIMELTPLAWGPYATSDAGLTDATAQLHLWFG